MWIRRALVSSAAIAMASAALIGALVAPAAAKTTEEHGTSYVGTVAGSDAYVGIVVGAKHAFAYVCDGQDLAHWLKGKVKRGAFVLVDTGGGLAAASLIGAVHGRTLDGTLVLPDETPHAFTAHRAKGKAGLYRDEQSIDGVGYAGGWVQLANGSFKGQVTVARLPQAIPPSSVATMPPTTAPGANAVLADRVGAIAPLVILNQFSDSPPPDAKVATAPAGSESVFGSEDNLGGGATPSPSAVPTDACQQVQDAVDKLRQIDRELSSRAKTKFLKGQISAIDDEIIGIVFAAQTGGCPNVT